MGQIIEKYFCNPEATSIYQIIAAFFFGVILSPWSSGVIFLIVTAIIIETLLIYYTKMHRYYYNAEVRAACVMASIFGFILGRIVSNKVLLPNYNPIDDLIV